MRLILLPVILAVVSVASSCGKLLLPPLEIVSISPSPGPIDPNSINAIEVTFSANPTPESAERGFSLSSDGSKVAGVLSVTGNVLRFAPRAGFASGHDYSMTVGDAIETRDGISIEEGITIEYTTRVEGVPPSVVRVAPENGAELSSPLECVVITFSEPVTMESVSRAVSLSPSVNRMLKFSDDGLSVTLIPTDQFALGTRYTVKVSDALSDPSGNSLRESFVSSFLCGTDRVAPNYAITVDSVPLAPCELMSVGAKDPLRFIMSFDEPLPDNAALGKILTQPPLRTTILQDSAAGGSIVTVEIDERPVWGKEYSLLVRKGIADESGNAIDEDTEFRFVSDRERDRPLIPIKAYLDVGRGIAEPTNRYTPLSPADAYRDLVLPAEAWPMDEPVTTCLYVFVRGSAESTGVTRASAMGCAAFEASNSCVTAKMTRIETGLASGSICDAVRDLVSADEELRDGGGIVFAVKIDLEVTNRDGRGLIRIGLDKGLRDGIGNETDSDWSVTVNKA